MGGRTNIRLPNHIGRGVARIETMRERYPGQTCICRRCCDKTLLGIFAVCPMCDACRPLNMEELFFAVLSGLPGRSNQPSTWTKPELEKFVVTNSRGLVELDKSSSSIRFIHQTVPEILREFFEENGITYDYFEAQEYMRQSCENYLYRPTSLASYVKSSTLVELIHVKFPFLRYALESHDYYS